MDPIELLSGPVPVILVILGVAAFMWLVVPRTRQQLRLTIPVVLAATFGATVLLKFLTERVWNTWGAPLDTEVYLWVWLALAAVTLGSVRIIQAVRKRPPAWVGRAALWLVSTLLAVVAAAELVNLHFGEYATVGSLFGRPGLTIETITPINPPESTPTQQPTTPEGRAQESARATKAVKEADWNPPEEMPKQGKVVTTEIPSPVSGLPTSAAFVYLPPAYLTNNRPNLPVLVLLHGVPGRSLDWLDGGRLASFMDAFAARHKGLTPVVVMPDVGGNFAPNPPLCLDTKLGRSATYLAEDVPAWAKHNLGAGLADRHQWAIAGFSYGGTCALQLAVNRPEVYPTFIDISGEVEPTINAGRDALIRLYFDGDRAAFARQNALDVLKTRSYPDTAGIVTIGESDSFYGPQGAAVAKAAAAVGMNVQLKTVPGSHTWQAWRAGLETNLDWLMTRLTSG
ncbi:alpha/beta hydrolase family protein [Arthrobacter sp. M4]|uniref:alpha/beta hydrolase n=1 Tax=Arthrobacter sp. M4 TaxID=218160 RepID=UPI001CDB50C4|nr:alpha/beta hydrolase-fold protein [Arthrobacter sp. M4]MCA4134592.1 esterase family protein [Arthrobacter sp. M4]